MVVSDLDVFERVGRGVAHDEYIEFRVENNKILFQVIMSSLFVHSVATP